MSLHQIWGNKVDIAAGYCRDALPIFPAIPPLFIVLTTATGNNHLGISSHNGFDINVGYQGNGFTKYVNATT